MSDVQKPSSSSRFATDLRSGGFAADPPALNPDEEEEDRQHVQKIITALRFYRKYSNARVHKAESYLNTLPQRHQAMLTKYRDHLTHVHQCIDENQTVIRRMLRENIFSEPNSSSSLRDNAKRDTDGHVIKIRTQDIENPEHVDVEPFKILKAQSTLKLIARDWSDEGAEEREQSYKPIIAAIEEFFNPSEYAANAIKVLVPGAGLGRLTYELACRGYDCEGNEFSYFMMIASNFVLNQCTEARKYTLYPWIHQYVNNLRMEDQVAAIRFPDICPEQPKGKLAFAAGDFLLVYTMPDCYDCVATCFFIDCANNIIDFIETIYRILIPGGIWVNLGPLLYHFSDIQGECSIEPTFENIIHIIEMVGFETIRTKTGIRTKYAQNPKSMLKTEYESVFWICRKPMNIINDDFSDESDKINDVVEGNGDSTDNTVNDDNINCAGNSDTSDNDIAIVNDANSDNSDIIDSDVSDTKGIIIVVDENGKNESSDMKKKKKDKVVKKGNKKADDEFNQIRCDCKDTLNGSRSSKAN